MNSDPFTVFLALTSRPNRSSPYFGLGAARIDFNRQCIVYIHRSSVLFDLDWWLRYADAQV